MKDYSKMSNFEINSAVHNSVNGLGFNLEFLGCDRIKWSRKGDEDIFTGKCDYTPNGLRDYCNNPSDAWPIIFENEISLVVVEDGLWVARFGSVFDESSNPLRSAMIVYLMMKDEEK